MLYYLINVTYILIWLIDYEPFILALPIVRHSKMKITLSRRFG